MTVFASRRISIRGALMVCFVLIAALAVLVTCGHRYYWLTTELERDEQIEDLQLARAVALSLDRFMTARRHLIATLATEVSTLGRRDTGQLTALIETARRRELGFTSIGILDSRGIALAYSPVVDETGAAIAGRSFADRQYFIEAARLETRPSYDVVISRIARRPAVAMAAPIRGTDGKFVGIVSGGIDLAVLRSATRDIDAEDADRLVVVDARGRVIAHSSPQWEAEARDLSREAVFLAARRAAEGTTAYQSEFSGTTRRAAFVRVPSTGWVVWASRGPELRAARLRSLVRSLLFSGVASLVAAAAASVFLSKLLTRPLRSLADSTRHIAQGDLTRADALPRQRTSVREFAELDAGFRTMAEALQAQHQVLEGKVAERTRALEDAARAAEATSARLRAQEEIRRGYGELAALLNSLDQSHILNEGIRKIAASLRAPVAAVYLTDNGPESLRLKTHWALDTSALDSGLLVPGGLPTRVAENLEPVIVDGPLGADGLRLRTGVGELRVAAVAGYPLRYQERFLGVLIVALVAAPDEDIKSFLESAAGQLSVALNNAGLFEAVRYGSQRMEELNAALQRASQAKSQFLSSMSHELRTPLNGIIGFTDVLLMPGRDPLTERQRTALGKVASSGRHLLGLINQILDLSKIEAGRLEVRVQAFALPPLVAECLATVEPQAQAKALALRAVGVVEAPELLQDRDKLKQILVNLLSNAVKFTAAGHVELRVATDGDSHITLAVADTGAGVPPEQQTAIFEEFHQVDGAGSERGTGLGLAISRRLAALIGGTLTVHSAPGQGSVFTLRVPQRLVPRPDRPRFVPSAVVPGGTRVLVIEDDQNALEIIREAVADQPITVEWAASARSGLERARSMRPDGIVLDVMLQDGDDGWQVLERLKGDPATRDIPVVLHSVIDNPDRARRLGAEGVLPKPADPATIAAMMRRFRAAAPTAPSGTLS
jgi:signal transduction histidine kinase/CheY-like chemotaxis protein/HAMP domain-containing protein